MCSACGYPVAPGHWTDAGAKTPGDRLRLRFVRLAAANRLLALWGLKAHDDGERRGFSCWLPTGGANSCETSRRSGAPRRTSAGRVWRRRVALSTWLSAPLSARGDDVVRVKGVVRTPAGRLVLQSVRQHVQPPEILPDGALTGLAPEEGAIVLIGRNVDQGSLARSWERFDA